MLTKRIYGVDFGTSTVKIYSYKKNQILKEKNMLAVKDKYEVLAVGNEAFEMYEKAPDNIEVSTPMSYGMIADIDRSEVVLHTLLKRCDKYIGRRPVLYFAVPTNMTEIEKRAYLAITKGGDFRKAKVFIVERPMADAIAMGIDVQNTKGTMIVNLGAQSSELSIIADGRVIISKTIHIGGKQLNNSICDLIRRKKNLLIGSRTSRRLKFALASLLPAKKEARKIVGVNTVSGLPRECIISSSLIGEALIEPVNAIGEEIKYFLERTPPQIAQLIINDGIYIAGGCTHIPNLATYIANYIGYPVHLSDNYELSTIKGLESIISNKDLHIFSCTIKEKIHH